MNEETLETLSDSLRILDQYNNTLFDAVSSKESYCQKIDNLQMELMRLKLQKIKNMRYKDTNMRMKSDPPLNLNKNETISKLTKGFVSAEKIETFADLKEQKKCLLDGVSSIKDAVECISTEPLWEVD